MIDESLPVAEDVVSRSDDKNLSSEMRRHIADGFIFFDWFSIPQKSRKHEGNPNNGAALAVRSIPAYVELSSLFIALVPELTHKESLSQLGNIFYVYEFLNLRRSRNLNFQKLSQPMDQESPELVNYATWLSRGWL